MIRKLLFVGLVATASNALAQDRAGAASKPPALLPFDTSATIVRREQIAHLDDVFAALRPLPRSEFETSQAYRTRISAMAFMPVGVAFEGSDDGHRFKYDADKQQMTFSFMAGASSASLTFDAVVAGFYRQSLGFSTGTNTFGAQIRFEKVAVRSLQFRPVRAHTSVSFDILPSRSWLLAADAAQNLKPFLAALLITVPTVPDSGDFIWKNQRFFAATVNSPVESTSCSETISVSSLALWIYDMRDGRVLQKFDLSSGDPQKSRYAPMSPRLFFTPCT